MLLTTETTLWHSSFPVSSLFVVCSAIVPKVLESSTWLSCCPPRTIGVVLLVVPKFRVLDTPAELGKLDVVARDKNLDIVA